MLYNMCKVERFVLTMLKEDLCFPHRSNVSTNRSDIHQSPPLGAVVAFKCDTGTGYKTSRLACLLAYLPSYLLTYNYLLLSSYLVSYLISYLVTHLVTVSYLVVT